MNRWDESLPDAPACADRIQSAQRTAPIRAVRRLVKNDPATGKPRRTLILRRFRTQFACGTTLALPVQNAPAAVLPPQGAEPILRTASRMPRHERSDEHDDPCATARSRRVTSGREGIVEFHVNVKIAYVSEPAKIER